MKQKPSSTIKQLHKTTVELHVSPSILAHAQTELSNRNPTLQLPGHAHTCLYEQPRWLL